MTFVTPRTNRRSLTLALRILDLVLVYARGSITAQPCLYNFRHGYSVCLGCEDTHGSVLFLGVNRSPFSPRLQRMSVNEETYCGVLVLGDGYAYALFTTVTAMSVKWRAIFASTLRMHVVGVDESAWTFSATATANVHVKRQTSSSQSFL